MPRPSDGLEASIASMSEGVIHYKRKRCFDLLFVRAAVHLHQHTVLGIGARADAGACHSPAATQRP
jgi:hypothetical protein